MTQPTIRVERAGDVEQAFRRLGDDLDDMRGANADAARLVEEQAAQRAPRRSGQLVGSLRSWGEPAGGFVAVGEGLPYGGVIHFGWPGHNIEPQPFLYDALDERREAVLEVYEERVNQLIKQRGLG